jgi:hypothetical protein
LLKLGFNQLSSDPKQMSHFKLFTIASFIFCLAFPASAQGVKAEVRLLAFDTSIPQPDIFIQDPAAEPTATSTAATLKSYLNHQYASVSLQSRKLVFTTKPDRASITREGELVGEVMLPAGGDSAILLFLPGKPGGKGKYQIMPVADSKKSFPAGSFHVTNLSPVAVRLLLEKKPFEFKPGQTSLIEDPPVRDGAMIGMRAFAFIDKAWLEVSASLWTHPGRGRGLMIIFQDPVSKDIQLKAFDDIPPREVDQPNAPAL